MDTTTPENGAARNEPEPLLFPTVADFDAEVGSTERAIPVRPSDLVRALASDPALAPHDRNRFLQLAKLLGALLHFEYYDWLVQLKDLYSPLDPDTDCATIRGASTAFAEDSDEKFLKTFEAALIRANYRPLSLAVVEKAVAAPNELGLNYVPDFTIFEHLKIYVRGRTRVSRFVRTVRTRFRRREVIHPGYSRLVVILKFRPNAKRLDQYARSDVLYLRLFKDVPHVDMEMHLPEQGTKVRMRMIDKAQIASPVLTGIPLFLAKVFLNLSAGVPIGVLVAPFTAGVNSFFGFQRAKQKHLAYMIRHLYYLTLANNASVINRLIDSAEEEDFKEALLAYFFLWKGHDDPEPWDQARLDRTIEVYLKSIASCDIDFEISDASGKLLRLGLAHVDGQGRLYATPIDTALARLDELWDDAFKFPSARSSRGKSLNKN